MMKFVLTASVAVLLVGCTVGGGVGVGTGGVGLGAGLSFPIKSEPAKAEPATDKAEQQKK
ncbi:hypothetical protein UXN85_20700 [Enterobacter hormaechei]